LPTVQRRRRGRRLSSAVPSRATSSATSCSISRWRRSDASRRTWPAARRPRTAIQTAIREANPPRIALMSTAHSTQSRSHGTQRGWRALRPVHAPVHARHVQIRHVRHR
jgi:hypothetical protein